jgi:hypothetical protein
MEDSLMEQTDIMSTSIADSCPDWYQWINHWSVVMDSFLSELRFLHKITWACDKGQGCDRWWNQRM